MVIVVKLAIVASVSYDLLQSISKDIAMKESHLRSIIKATSWRLFGTFSTTMLAFVVTHKWDLSLYIGVLEFVSKIALYYFHERLWMKIPLGLMGGRGQKAADKVVFEWQDT